jgi:hypothetical protein
VTRNLRNIENRIKKMIITDKNGWPYNVQFAASMGAVSLDNKCATSSLIPRGKFSESHASGKPLSILDRFADNTPQTIK